MARLASGHTAWQGPPHVDQDAVEVNRFYEIDSAEKQISETRGKWRCCNYSINARSREFEN